jgi:hypothetical protein
MFLQEISRIMAAAGISTSEEEHIFTAIKNLVVSPHEELEVSSDSSCQFVEGNKESWMEFNGEKPVEHEIEESLACLLANPVCTPKTNHLEEDNLHSIVEEDI